MTYGNILFTMSRERYVCTLTDHIYCEISLADLKNN